MRIGVYGGTFDPPHLGHMESARAVADILKLDKLLFIPTMFPPHKLLPQNAAGADHRLAMTALMADGLGLGGRAETLDLELRRGGRSYTVSTLEELRMQYPQDELWLLIGGDMLLGFRSWFEYRRILGMAKVAAFARTGRELEELYAKAGSLNRESGGRVSVLEMPQVYDISSTQVRRLLREGMGAACLWPPVYGYILREGLYGTHADLKKLGDDDLRAVSFSMIKAKRIKHVQGTEDTALRLATRYGADQAKARRAAILHDCTKYLTLDEQLQLCEKYGILLDSLERKTLKLLHSKSGAALAEHLFGEPEDVCGAICWHTTGRAGMTTLEKVIYLADYIEPSRDFNGVERLRRLAREDLNAAVRLGLEMTILEMNERGLPVHPNTAQALEWLKG